MIEFILMLLGLAFPNNNANTATSNDNNYPIVQPVTQGGPTDPIGGVGGDGDTGGNTGQKPPTP
ncbi:hypothetical protein RAH57_10455 [Chryseobacterium sp. CKR4-1]|uniref:hypothetical protein n=1 Tax=Chryseobacterium sp. CKR4-1 TaxID=3068896 RepID=UPI0027966E9C|nr:hypothetical protein [Chryseobacterium sp. CKR4-1]MDQ1804412.1 hypothetical protein [Chryseobacterium sp. CKR4-1]